MRSLVTIFFAVSLLTSAAGAQPGEYRRGVQQFPCLQSIPKGHQLNLDFGQLCFYEQANAKLSQPTQYRVVYFGDSITLGWGAHVQGLIATDTINRGISGQTTAQMLVRFRADVLNLKPRVVHLLMGANDIAGNTGATSVQRIKEAIASMAEQARVNGIRVVLASILPATRFSWRPEISPSQTIREINQWLEGYSKREGFIYVDYYSVLNDGQGGFAPMLANDGVHPNAAGYDRMKPLAAEAIRKAAQSN